MICGKRRLAKGHTMKVRLHGVEWYVHICLLGIFFFANPEINCLTIIIWCFPHGRRGFCSFCDAKRSPLCPLVGQGSIIGALLCA